MIRLSKRLQAVCDMVPEGSRVCDVGCDHAHVDIRLLQEGRAVSALAMDIAAGPLARAQENLELTGLSDRCELRRSDGLAAYEPGEADTMICTGMGGLLLRSILEAGEEKVRSFRELILSPQRDIELVREWLAEHAFRIADEVFLEDVGKYYTVMLALPPSDCDADAELPPGNGSGRTELPPGSGRDRGDFSATIWTERKGLPLGNGPDWDALAQKVRALSEEEEAQLMLDRGRVLILLEDPSFRSCAENRFGPCILRKFLSAEGEDGSSGSSFGRFVTGELRTNLEIAAQLQDSPESATAAARLQQVCGNIGILQVLLGLNQMLRQCFGGSLEGEPQ